MNTLDLLERRAAGLRAQLDALRADERLFQRAAGLETQREKDHAARLELEAKLDAAKKTLTELRDRKAEAMRSTATAIAEVMGRLLPYGEARFNVDDEGGVFLGWELPRHGVVPYGGLSGGQRILFESALAYALTRRERRNTVILIEGAELGQEIGLLLEGVATATAATQIIACTCHEPAAVSEGWTAVEVMEQGYGKEHA